MDNLPVIAKCHVNGIIMEICYGEIPGIFQALWFDPITPLELPDAKATDEEFYDWLTLYRDSINWYDFSVAVDPTTVFEHHLLKESLCN